jgi:nicotinate-nucleotide adenylyltransferase
MKNDHPLIGIFGGTFDPIHFGHINLALEMKEKHHLDEVWFIPAKVNPFKLDKKLQPLEHRRKMVELALEDIPGFKVHDVESQREGPSFTVDTIRLLTSENPDKTFRLLLSDETADHFYRWREPEEICKMAPLLIGTRHFTGDHPPTFKGISAPEAWTPIRMLVISATDIRSRLKNGLYCGHLVPKKVLDYIYRYRLYS